MSIGLHTEGEGTNWEGRLKDERESGGPENTLRLPNSWRKPPSSDSFGGVCNLPAPSVFQLLFQAPYREGSLWPFLLSYDFFMTEMSARHTTAEQQLGQLQLGPS